MRVFRLLSDPEFLFRLSWNTALALAGAVVLFTLFLIVLKKARAIWKIYRARRVNRYNHIIYDFVDDSESLFESLAKLRPLKTLNRLDRRILGQTVLTLSETFAGTWGERLCFIFDELGFADLEIGRTASFFAFERAAAARRLGQMKSVKAIPALNALLKDKSAEVKISAAEALAKIGALDSLDIEVEALADYSRIGAIQVAELVKAAPKAAVPILLKLCEHSDPKVQLFAIELLGLVNDPRSKGTLLKLYRSESMEIRIACLRAISVLKEEDFLAAFVSRLGDKNLPWQERAQVAKMMGAGECLPAIGVLQRCLCDPSYWVRRNAGEALSKMGESGKQALAAALDFSDRFARDMALEWLDEIGYVREPV